MAAMEQRSEETSVEHLHLHMRRTHWETACHDNLGTHLQDALDRLGREGWEVVAAYAIDRTPEVILKRPLRRPQGPAQA